MGLLLILLYLLTIAGSLAIVFKTNIKNTISTTIFMTIMLLYVSSIFGKLSIGLILCGILFLIMLVLLILGLRKQPVSKAKYILNFSLLFFLLFFLFSWKINSLRMLSAWDEFSHWGLVTKNMFYINDLGSSATATTYFKGYPPAVSLFQYFWAKLYGTFVEGNLFRAMNIFNFALLLPMISFDKKNKSFFSYAISALIVILVPLTFFDAYYSNIYVDATLGLLFAFILYTYFTDNANTKLSQLNILLASAVLILTKASGMGLAVIAFLIILVDQLFFQDKKLRWKFLHVLLPYLITIVVTNQSWKIFLKISDAKVAWDTSPITINNFVKVLTGQGKSYQYTTIANFINKVFSQDFLGRTFNMTFFLWVVLSIGISCIILSQARELINVKRIKASLIGVHIGGVIYTATLLILYLFTYSEYEAMNLASITRYLNTYLIGLFMYLIGMLFYVLNEKFYGTKFKQKLIIILLSVLVFTNVEAISSYIFLNKISVQKSIEVRAPYFVLEKAKKDIENMDEKIYFISQNTSGFDYWQARYTFSPNHINDNTTWSIGERYGEKDIWTVNISPEEWSNTLKSGFEYVYIYRADEGFYNRYSDLFQDTLGEDNTLYRVNKESDDSTVKLEKIKSY